ncbi:hypothetical protein [Pseudomonas extremaustralis]|uniref:hypothetical protein n=1 Tax=Pseudomonas extremaustralis TaxID=359110 RepID=UPI002307B4D9|nr:hypothetical protein [Pseudomonas extremaustralis]MDB1113662.1 hypothetical protein [Pseudomonas extremaustralis]
MDFEKVFGAADWQFIKGEVQSTYSEHFSQYSYIKYPAQDYQRFKQTFSAFEPDAELDLALLWKWGHWGKIKYPAKQALLITEISALWGGYFMWVGVVADAPSPKDTFEWWSNRLRRPRYITSAFLTHLIHPSDVPIIDQHNFRAMNHFLRVHKPKKKPSNWDDIAYLKRFLTEATTKLQYSESNFDKYLMMYGRALKPREPKTSRKEQA